MGAVLNIISGALLSLPALAILVGRGRQRAGLSLGLGLLAWSLTLVSFNLGDLPGRKGDPDLSTALGTAFAIVTLACLGDFAWSLAAPRGPGGWRALSWPMLFGLGVAVTFALRPQAYIRAGGIPTDPWHLLVNVPFYLALFAILLFATRAYQKMSRGRARAEVAVILAAMGAYTGYVAPYFLVLRLATPQDFVVTRAVSVYVVLWLSAILLCGWSIAQLIRRRNDRVARAIAGVIVVALALGFLTAAPAFFGLPRIGISGLFTILAAFLLAYGILKHQIFGLDLNAKRFLQRGAPVAAFLLLGLTGATVGDNVAPDAVLAGMPAFLTVGLVTGGTGAAVALPLRRRLADALFPEVDESTTYAKRRALDVYQAALAQALASGGDEDDASLVVLRDRLGLTASDHRALVYAVRTEIEAAPRAPVATVSIASRYERKQLLKDGPVARVWLAHDKEAGRDVVLKQFRPGDAAPEEEARAARGLANPHVVEVLGLFEDDERRPTLVLEYVDGGSLQQRLDDEGRIALAPALALAADVLRGLVAVHARDVVHQDIKPDNVLLTRAGRAKLTDFGIAARVEQDLGQTMAAGAGAGTVLYMSPEQALARPVDVAADLYAVGAVLYRCLAGHLYFETDGPEYEIKRRIVEDPPFLPLADQPKAVNELLERALAKAPRQRFGSAAEMLAAIEAVSR